MFMEILPSWNYKEVVNNIETIESEYTSTIVSFSCFNLKDKCKYIRQVKDQIYQLKMSETKRNRIWQYLNGDVDYESLLELL